MKIRIAEYPELKLIAWNRKDDLIEGDEVLALYERNWRYVDHANITEKERQLIDRLVTQFGNDIFFV